MGIKKNSSSQGISKISKSIKEKNGVRRRANQPKARSLDTMEQSTELDKPQLIWQVVASIPKAKVASYGQIAELAGLPGYARYVGTTLSRLPAGTKLPWHRVVNAAMKIAERGGSRMIEQRRLLEAEGVVLIGEKVLKQHRWQI
jgi:methylated-DNA-protein-cysteine methyltransferase-like protein|tara:strand:+ start:136 stop:567 length:432 start_codon:yes stop_codon:yes gene_type:complete